MPITSRCAYFEHAAVSPLPAPSRAAIGHWLAEASEEGALAWLRWDRRLQEVRATAAAMIGADAEEIALVGSTTVGVTYVAEGFPWREGDNVVLPADEFPANQYPWLNLASRGVETRRVPVENGCVDLNHIEAACDNRTRIVALSWVGFLSGWRTDLAAAAEIAHRHGALLFVDAIQGLGAFPLNVSETGIDLLAAGGQKWLLSPEGTALLYLRRDHLLMLRPLNVGADSMVHSRDYTRIEMRLKDAASRYEGGATNMVGFIGLGASLDLLTGLGLAAIGQRILEITDLCCRRLEQIGAEIISPREAPEHRSGIVSFTLPGCNLNELRKHCLSRNVAVCLRADRLRISPHAYIDENDVERLIESLEEGIKAKR